MYDVGHRRGEGYGDDDVMLRRQREMRGPYAIIYNLPEDRSLTTDAQLTKDYEDVVSILEYIVSDTEGHERLDNKVKGVIRLGRRQEGKCRPIRVQFVGQMYRDIAVKLSFHIRYHHDNEVFKRTVISKDLCREDRERAKQKYIEKKQRREAGEQQSSSTETGEWNQSPPQDIGANRPEDEDDISSSPLWVTVDSAT